MSRRTLTRFPLPRTLVAMVRSVALWAVTGCSMLLPLTSVGGVKPDSSVPPSHKTIGILFDSLVSPFWVQSLDSMRQEAARRNWSALEAVSDMDDSRQYQQVQAMIRRGVDGIIIVQTDAKAVIPAIRAANAAHIPMVHFNRPPADTDAYSVSVVADNRALMRQTVQALLKEAHRQGGHYKAAILLGDLSDSNGLSRRRGFLDAMAGQKDVEIVAQIATEWNADKAYAGLTNALEAHPDINFLVTSSDFMAPQIEQALRQAGKWKKAGEPGHVLLAGFDGDENGYRLLHDGYYDVDGVQNLDYEVKLTFSALDRMIAGEKPPKVILDPGVVVTRENLIARRADMWGYKIWRSNARGAPQPASASGATATGLADFRTALHALFSWGTAADIIRSMLPLAILVAGQMLVLLIGQIDLSITSIMALGSIMSAAVMTRHASFEPLTTGSGIVAFLIIGLAVGLFNGVCTAILQMPSFIVTLAVMMAGGGAAVWYASSVTTTISIGGLPAAFRTIGYGTVLGIPIAFLISLGVLVAIGYILSRTIYGRWIYAIGHNARAALISGVPVAAITIAVFAVSGMCAGLAALIYTSRMETGLPTLGQTMLLDVVGAAVIGGVSLFGGRGNLRMVIGGVLFLTILDKVLQILGFSQFLVLAIKGTAILAAAVFDVMRQRRRVAA